MRKTQGIQRNSGAEYTKLKDSDQYRSPGFNKQKDKFVNRPGVTFAKGKQTSN